MPAEQDATLAFQQLRSDDIVNTVETLGCESTGRVCSARRNSVKGVPKVLRSVRLTLRVGVSQLEKVGHFRPSVIWHETLGCLAEQNNWPRHWAGDSDESPDQGRFGSSKALRLYG